MAITLAHGKNNNYEFDLVQAGRHRTMMAAPFDAASGMRAQIGADRLSIVEMLPAAIARIENFDAAISAAVAAAFGPAFEEASAAGTQPNERRQSRPSWEMWK